MQNKKSKFKKGFTIIEMLIVIAIIGILTSLMVVSFGRTQKSAKDTRRKSNVENVKGAMSMYYSIKGGWPSDAALGNWNTLMTELSTNNGLIDTVSNVEDGETVYTVCKCGTADCNCAADSALNVARLCAKCMLTNGTCPNSPIIVTDNYCTYVK